MRGRARETTHFWKIKGHAHKTTYPPAQPTWQCAKPKNRPRSQSGQGMAADMTDAVMVMNATEIQSLVNDAILRALVEWAARQAGAIRAAVLQALDERAREARAAP